MRVRKFFADFDYHDVCNWWRGHKWPVAPLEYLPENGLIIDHEGHKLCAGWLYKTDSKFCLLEWIVGNPKSDKMDRSLALELLIEKLVERAKELGFGAVWTATQHEGLLVRYRKQDFVVADENMTSLLRRI